MAATALRAATIGQVIVRQQWPWSADVKVEYVVTGVTRPVDIAITEAYEGDVPLDVSRLNAAATGDRFGIRSSGTGSFVIDVSRAFEGNRSGIGDFRIRLGATESSDNVNEVVYKVFDLATGGCQDVTRADILGGKMGTFETDYSKVGPGFSTSLDDVLIWTGVTNREYATTKLVMRRIPGAGKTFTMGSPESETGRAADGSENQHEVTLAGADYFIGVFPLTVAQVSNFCKTVTLAADSASVLTTGRNVWMNFAPFSSDVEADKWRTPISIGYPCVVMRGLGSDWPASGHDVDSDSLLHLLRQRTGVQFDLPTEAQWEFACRAGTVGALPSNRELPDTWSGGGGLREMAWYDGNSGPALHPVGEKAPNGYGLYDMLGSVVEMCLDYYESDTSKLPAVDQGGLEGGGRNVRDRVVKGGAYNMMAMSARSAARFMWEEQEWCIRRSGARVVCPVGENW